MREFVIGCDNAGVAMKNALRDYLRQLGREVEDMGCYRDDDPTVYPQIAERVCKSIIDSDYAKRGILICGTGIGMCMSANKFKGIRAAVCHDPFSTERSILSNDGNVLCMGQRVLGLGLARKILKDWIDLEFVDGPSTPKVEAIIEIERQNYR